MTRRNLRSKERQTMIKEIIGYFTDSEGTPLHTDAREHYGSMSDFEISRLHKRFIKKTNDTPRPRQG